MTKSALSSIGDIAVVVLRMVRLSSDDVPRIPSPSTWTSTRRSKLTLEPEPESSAKLTCVLKLAFELKNEDEWTSTMLESSRPSVAFEWVRSGCSNSERPLTVSRSPWMVTSPSTARVARRNVWLLTSKALSEALVPKVTLDRNVAGTATASEPPSSRFSPMYTAPAPPRVTSEEKEAEALTRSWLVLLSPMRCGPWW